MKKNINVKMEDLVLFRGTKQEICDRLNSIGIRNDCFLEAAEYAFKDTDFCFNTNLGIIDDKYLDFEIYLLSTNKKDVFIVTEVNAF